MRVNPKGGSPAPCGQGSAEGPLGSSSAVGKLGQADPLPPGSHGWSQARPGGKPGTQNEEIAQNVQKTVN